jgi:DNA-binding transcriptional LysR family regulator
MHKEKWDDLRFLLSVAEKGSVSAAARALGVNHATVLRRIAAFEDRHGGEIFERTPQGYILPEDRKTILAAMREVEAAVFAVQRLIEGSQTPLRGLVRVTSTDTLCHGLLPDILAGLAKHSADLQIEVICSNSHLDLARLAADIAVKPAARLQDGLDGAIGAQLGFAVYGDPDLPWLGMSGAIAHSKPAQWLARQTGEAGFAAKADSFLTLREMVAAGIGKAILPCLLGNPDPRLRKSGPARPDLAVGIWVACHPDMAEVPRIKAVRSFLLEALAERAEQCLGT